MWNQYGFVDCLSVIIHMGHIEKIVLAFTSLPTLWNYEHLEKTVGRSWDQIQVFRFSCSYTFIMNIYLKYMWRYIDATFFCQRNTKYKNAILMQNIWSVYIIVRNFIYIRAQCIHIFSYDYPHYIRYFEPIFKY